MVRNSGQPDSGWLTVREVMEHLRTSRATVMSMVKSGRLVGVRLGTRKGWRIQRASLTSLEKGT